MNKFSKILSFVNRNIVSQKDANRMIGNILSKITLEGFSNYTSNTNDGVSINIQDYLSDVIDLELKTSMMKG